MRSPAHPFAAENASQQQQSAAAAADTNNSSAYANRTTVHNLDNISRRIQALDQKMLYVERREQDGWKVAAQQLNDLTEQGQSGVAAIANLEMRLSRELQRMEDTIGKELQVEMQRRSEAETRAKEGIAQAAAEVREAINALEGNRFALLDRRIDDIATTVSELCGVFDKRLSELSAQVASMSNAAATEVVRIENLVDNRRRDHEANEVRVLQLLEDTCTSLHHQLTEERRLREEATMRLEKLLIESAQKPWVRA